MKKESKHVHRMIERKVKPEFRERYLDIMRELRLSTELGDLIESVTLLEHKVIIVVEIYEYSEKIKTIDMALMENLNEGNCAVFRERFRKIIPEENIESRFFVKNGRVCQIIERQVNPEHLDTYHDIIRELRISSNLGDITDVQVAYRELSIFTELYEYSSKYQDIANAFKANEENKVSPAFKKRFSEIIEDNLVSSKFLMSV